MAVPKTFEEHVEYLRDTLALKMWFLRRWLRDHPDETVFSVLKNRVDILRKTDIVEPGREVADADFESSRWMELAERCAAAWRRTRDDADSRAFEEAGVAVFMPAVLPRAERDFAAHVPGKGMKCGSLTYRGIDPKFPDVIAVHIANALQPASIFDDPLYLPRCLLELMEKSHAEFGVTKLHCGSWLNSHPRWLALFPREWTDSRGPEDRNVQWHLGFWGQFITARGTFHARNAASFRATGLMPFAFRTADCGFAALRAHLAALPPKGSET